MTVEWTEQEFKPSEIPTLFKDYVNFNGVILAERWHKNLNDEWDESKVVTIEVFKTRTQSISSIIEGSFGFDYRDDRYKFTKYAIIEF